MSAEQEYQNLMEQGHSAAWDQQWEQAVSFYQQALEVIPDQPTALTNLGLAYFQLHKYPASLACYARAAELTPDDPMPLEKAGELQELTGDLEAAAGTYMQAAELYAKNRDINRAVETWIRVLKINPAYFLAHSRLALVYERLGKKTDAVRELLAMASLLQHAGEITKAVQVVIHALRLVPDSQEAGEALSLLRAGKPLPKISRPGGDTGPLVKAQLKEMAARELELPEAEGPDPIEEARRKALNELAGLVFDSGEDEAGDEPARRGMQAIVRGIGLGIDKAAERAKIILHLTQAVDLQSRGQGAQALADLTRAVDAGLDHPAAAFDLGLLYFENGETENALRQLQKSLLLPEYALASRLVRGQIYQKMEKPQEASVEFMEALRVADKMTVSPEEAELLDRQYEPLIGDLHGQDSGYHTRLCANISDLLVRTGWKEKLEQARMQLPASGEGEPPVPLAEVLTEASGGKLVESIHRVNQLTRLGQYRAAMEEAYFALEQAPTYLPMHSYIGDLLLQQNYDQFAIEKFNIVARAYSVRGQPNRAVDVYRRLISMDPANLKIRKDLIAQLAAMGRYEDAVNEYVKLGEVYYHQADRASARQTYIDGYRLAQQHNLRVDQRTSILKKIADLDLQSLNWRQAVKIFEQIRTLDPDDEQARGKLIELNFRLGQINQAVLELDSFISFQFGMKRHDSALEFVEKLAELIPKQPEVRRRLAELYRKAGRIEEAVAELDVTGDLLLESGDRKGAVDAIRAIVAMDPPNKEDYLKLLDQMGA